MSFVLKRFMRNLTPLLEKEYSITNPQYAVIAVGLNFVYHTVPLKGSLLYTFYIIMYVRPTQQYYASTQYKCKTCTALAVSGNTIAAENFPWAVLSGNWYFRIPGERHANFISAESPGMNVNLYSRLLQTSTLPR